MKKTKPNYVLYVMFVLLAIIVIILVIFNKKGNVNTDNNTINNGIENTNIISNNTLDNKNERKQITINEVDSYKDYFRIMGMIDSFCDGLSTMDKDFVYSSLDKNYIESNNITKENVLNKLNNYSGFPSFMISTLKYLDNVEKTIFIADGYLDNYDFEGNLIFSAKSKILVTTNNNYFNLYFIDKDTKIEDFLKIYDFDNNIVEKEENKINSIKLDEEDKIKYYLIYYKYLLIHYPDIAYDKLSNSTKQKYIDYNNFKDNVYDINDFINVNYYGYSVDKKSNHKKYKIDLWDNGKITIDENKLMDFTIDFKF